MAKPFATIRVVSILVGVIVGAVLAYAYQMNLPTLFYEVDVSRLLGSFWSLVVFAAVPLFAGFLVGVLNPSTGIKDGLLVGLLIGLVNSIIATVKLIFAPRLEMSEVFAFCVFAIMSVFIWMILSAAAADLAKKIYE